MLLESMDLDWLLFGVETCEALRSGEAKILHRTVPTSISAVDNLRFFRLLNQHSYSPDLGAGIPVVITHKP